MPTQITKSANSAAYHFPLKYRNYIAIVPNAGRQELLMKQLEAFRNWCTASFSYDKAWSKGRALCMGIDQERLVCLKTKTRKIPKAHVVLCVLGDELAVIHVEKDLHELDCDAFNKVVKAFQEECLTDEVMRHFKLRERVDYEPLDTVMSIGAAEALEVWEESCCMDREQVFSYDRKLWNDFVLAIHRDVGNEQVTGDFLKVWLKKVMNWRVETYSEVDRLAELLDYSNELLAEYRKEADERYDELSELYANCELDEAEEVFKGVLELKRITIGEIRKVMDAYFFEPEEEEDLYKIDRYLQVWVDLAYHEWKIGFTSKAIEICLILLDEIGRHFEEDGYYRFYDDLCPIDETCLNVAYVLTEIMRSPSTKQGIKHRILNGLKEVNRHDSFSNYCYFDLDQFIANKGVYEFPKLWMPGINITSEHNG